MTLYFEEPANVLEYADEEPYQDLMLEEPAFRSLAHRVGHDVREATWWQSASARFEESLTRAPVASIERLVELTAAKNKDTVKLTQEEWKESDWYRDGLEYEDGMTISAAKILADRKDRERILQDTMRRSDQGLFTQGSMFLVDMVGQLVDPVNIGLSFVPILGEARFLSIAGRAGMTTARLARGAIDATVGNVVAEIPVYLAAEQEQADYTLADSAMGVALGTVLGTGLHVGLGKVGDVLAANGGYLHKAAMQKALRDLAMNKDVDVSVILRAGNMPEVTENIRPITDDMGFLDVMYTRQQNIIEANHVAASERLVPDDQVAESLKRATEFHKIPGNENIDQAINKLFTNKKLSKADIDILTKMYGGLLRHYIPIGRAIKEVTDDWYKTFRDKRDVIKNAIKNYHEIDLMKDGFLNSHLNAKAQSPEHAAETVKEAKTVAEEDYGVGQEAPEPEIVDQQKHTQSRNSQLDADLNTILGRIKGLHNSALIPDEILTNVSIEYNTAMQEIKKFSQAARDITDTVLQWNKKSTQREKAIAEIKEKYGLALTDKDIAIVVNSIERDIDDYFKKVGDKPGAIDRDMALKYALEKAVNTYSVRKKIEIRNHLINRHKVASLTAQLMKSDNPVGLLKAILVGTTKYFNGHRYNIDAIGESLGNEILGKFNRWLRKRGYIKAFMKGDLDEDISEEMFNFREGGSTESITGNPAAYDIAKYIHDINNKTIDNLNSIGAYIKKLPGYVVKQIHNIDAIIKAGEQKWIDFILPLLDKKATFGDIDPALYRDWLTQAYRNMVYGKALKLGNEFDYDLKVTGNDLAAKMAAHRHLHFKDGKSFVNYNKIFGAGTLSDALTQGVTRYGRNFALMDTLGPNPRDVFEELISNGRRIIRENPAAAKERGLNEKGLKGLERIFNYVDGSAYEPGSRVGSMVGNVIRKLNNMSALGGVFITSFNDLPISLFDAMRHGGFGEIHKEAGRMIRTAGKVLRNKDDIKDFRNKLGRYLKITSGKVAQRYDIAAGMHSGLSKLEAKFFKGVGMEFWVDAINSINDIMNLERITDNVGKSFDELNPRMNEMLRAYGIDENMWDLIRTLPVDDVEGIKLVDIDAIMDIDDKKIAKLFPQYEGVARKAEVKAYKRRMLDTMRGYLLDRSMHSQLRPGAAEKAMALRGLEPGTIYGELARFFWQFKTFALSLTNRLWGETLTGAGSAARKTGDLATLMIMTTAMGLMVNMTKDLMLGKKPQEWSIESAPQILLRAALQGGSMGILGDVMFSQTPGYGRSWIGATLGPTAQTLEDIYKTAYEGAMLGFYGEGRPEAYANRVIRRIKNRVPFQNVFYTRAALDYLVWYRLQQAVDPISLYRMERNTEKYNFQTFIFPPSEVID